MYTENYNNTYPNKGMKIFPIPNKISEINISNFRGKNEKSANQEKLTKINETRTKNADVKSDKNNRGNKNKIQSINTNEVTIKETDNKRNKLETGKRGAGKFSKININK